MAPGLPQGPPITARYIRFGSLQIDQQRQRVFRDGNCVLLQGKALEVLIVLLQKQGEVATREELKRALWPTETDVNHDANLYTTMNKLRRVLGESTEKVPYIETISRKGYRFTGTVEFSDIPFAGIKSATSARSETIDPDRAQEVRVLEVFRSGKSLIMVIIALVLVGVLLGATLRHFGLRTLHRKSTTRLRRDSVLLSVANY
jgi:DNA-binding winged helix-turn-helix (wHTH) protein